MDIEGLRALLQRHGELLVEGRWEEIIESFDPSDGNFPIIVQFFSAHATEYEISDLRLRVESVQRGEGDAIEGVVFALDLESEVHAPARLRMRYALSQGEGPAIRRGGFGFRTGASLAGSEPLPVDDEPRDARSWRGWLDPARAELAARTVDGASLAELGRAATARLRAIDVAPRLASALTLANMMSTRVERVARAVADPAPLVQLARLHRYHLGAIEHLENHAEPAHACVDFIGANYPTLDDAAVYRRHDGRAYAVCGGQALFNLAVLHLGGASPRDVVHVGLKSPYAIHEQVLWNSSVGPLLLSNGYFEPWSARHFDDMRHVYRLSNCSVYVDERGASNLEPAQAEALAAWLREGFAHFDVSLLSTPRSAPAAELLETRSPEAARVRQEVWRRAAADGSGPEGLARYAYRSLVVGRPEAYLHHDLGCPLVAQWAREPGSARELAGRLAARVEGPSVYFEPERVLAAERVLGFGVGDRLDVHHVLAAVLRRRGERCLLAVGDGDVAVLLHEPGGWTTLRAGDDDGRPLERPQLLLDERAVHAPALGRDDRADAPYLDEALRATR